MQSSSQNITINKPTPSLKNKNKLLQSYSSNIQKMDMLSCMVCNVCKGAGCTMWKICPVSSSSECYWPVTPWSCYGLCNRGCSCTMVIMPSNVNFALLHTVKTLMNSESYLSCKLLWLHGLVLSFWNLSSLLSCQCSRWCFDTAGWARGRASIWFVGGHDFTGALHVL